MTVEELAQELDLPVETVRKAVANLIEKGLVKEVGGAS